MVSAVAAIQPGKHVAASANKSVDKKMSHTQVEVRRQGLCANGRVVHRRTRLTH